MGGYVVVPPSGGGGGTVVGPGVSTDNAIARYDGVTGTLIQDSDVIVDDNGFLIWPGAAGGLPAGASFYIGRSGGGNLFYNVPTGNTHAFNFNGLAFFEISETDLDFLSTNGSRFNPASITGQMLWSFADNGASGATFKLRQASSTPAVNDIPATYLFTGSTTAAATFADYAKIEGWIIDPTAGAEAGSLRLYAINGGAQLEHIRAQGTVTSFPNTSVGIGTNSPSSTLHVVGNKTVTGETATGNSAAYGVVSGVMRYSDTAWTVTDFTAVNSWRVDSARFIVNPDADYAGDTATARFSQITIPSTNANDFGTLFANNSIADHSGGGVVTQNIAGQSTARLAGAGTITTNVGHNVNVTGTSGGTGTVTNNYGIVITSGVANAAGTATNDYKIVLRSPDITGTVTNARAIYAEDHSIVTGGYFIYSEGGRSYHAGAIALGQNNFEVTVNGSSIPTKLSIHSEGAATQSEIEAHRYSDTATNGSIIHGARARGSIAAPSVVQSGDNLLDIVAVGHDGTDYAQGARIDFEVDGTPGANDMPGRVIIKTSPDGTQVPVEALRVDSLQSTIASGRVQTDKGVDVASANNLTLGTDGNLFVITGNTQINAITTANWQAGSQIILVFSGAPTVKHNTAGGAGTAVMFLAGSVDLVAAANTVLGLVYDGTQWQETFRKVA